MKKVYLFLAEGFEEVEALTTVDLLRRAGIDLKTVSVTGSIEVNGAHGIKVYADELFEKADFSIPDMLILPGGNPGWMNLEKHASLMEKIDYFANNGKWVAAICGAPSILGRRGLLKGKKACVYPGMEGDLLGAKPNERTVNVDGNIITSRGVGTAIDFSLAIIAELVDKKTAAKISSSIVYN